MADNVHLSWLHLLQPVFAAIPIPCPQKSHSSLCVERQDAYLFRVTLFSYLLLCCKLPSRWVESRGFVHWGKSGIGYCCWLTFQSKEPSMLRIEQQS
jgi:hypothetical protein